MYFVEVTHEGNRNTYRIFVGKPEGKDLLEMRRLIWDYNIKTNLNPLTPNDPYRGRTAPLTSKRCILYIY